jgi:hypothetical protein
MMFKYEQRVLKPGEKFEIKDGDMFTGTSLVPDGKGGCVAIAHIVSRVDDHEVVAPVAKELVN